MYHPAELDIVNADLRPRKYGSFVGVRAGGTGSPSSYSRTGSMTFQSEPAAVSRMFFGLYRSLRYYRRVQKRYRSAEEDGPLDDEGGFKLETKEGEEAVLYSKIPMLEAVIEGYDELRIASLLYRQRRTSGSTTPRSTATSTRLSTSTTTRRSSTRWCSRAPSSRSTRRRSSRCSASSTPRSSVRSASLSRPRSRPRRARSSRGTSPRQPALRGHRKSRTDDRVVKEKLYEIDRQKVQGPRLLALLRRCRGLPLREADEADDGTHWGITSFALIWEDMCLVWVRESMSGGVQFADTPRYANRTIGGHKVFVDPDFEAPFYFEMGIRSRYLRPDLVRHDSKGGLHPYLSGLFEVEQRETGCGFG